MKYIIILLISSFFVDQLSAQQINQPLKRELDSMYLLDQKYRALMSNPGNADSLARVFKIQKGELSGYLWKQQLQVDSTNIVRLEAILGQYGYPGKRLVGEPTNEAAFYVIQHSRVIDKYLPQIKEAAEKKDLPFHLYAMMLDRSLMFQGKEQIYGSQGSGFQVKDPASGQMQMKWVIWPIKDVATVNERRKAAGFTQTVEANAKRMDIEYVVYTLDQIKKMQEQR